MGMQEGALALQCATVSTTPCHLLPEVNSYMFVYCSLEHTTHFPTVCKLTSLSGSSRIWYPGVGVGGREGLMLYMSQVAVNSAFGFLGPNL